MSHFDMYTKKNQLGIDSRNRKVIMVKSETGIGNYGLLENDNFEKPRKEQDGLTKRKETVKDRAKLGH